MQKGSSFQIRNSGVYRKLTNKTKVKLTRPCVCKCVGPALCNIHEQIESYIENYSSNNNTNDWKTMKGLLKNFKLAGTIPVLRLNIDGIEYYFTGQEKARCSNEYFTSVSNLDDSNMKLPPFDCKVNASLDQLQIEQEQVEKNH